MDEIADALPRCISCRFLCLFRLTFIISYYASLLWKTEIFAALCSILLHFPGCSCCSSRCWWQS